MEMDQAIEWARDHKNATLITIRRDGRPQSPDIVYAPDAGAVVISITDDRAKTRNMRRDPRAVLHISQPSTWSYLSFDGTVELSDVTTRPGDATNDALCAYYQAVAGRPHPDWDEYRQAMVADKRLVARFLPASVTGQTH
jgi:PPOX class probable F420-dependent enzyme